jgi:hypothetical protein
MELGVSSRGAASGVDVVAAEVSPPVEGGLQRQVGEILVAEYNDFLPGNEKRKLVFSHRGQLAQLDTRDFKTYSRGEFAEGAAKWQQVFESAIGPSTAFNVGEWLKRRVFFTVVPGGKVLWILRTKLTSKRPWVICEKTLAVVVPPSSSICLLIFAGDGAILGTVVTTLSRELTPSVRCGAILVDCCFARAEL